MKTTALILGVLSVFAFSSCRCNLDEDESKKETRRPMQLMQVKQACLKATP